MTYGNEHAQISATQDRGAYDTIRIVKPIKLRADDDYQNT